MARPISDDLRERACRALAEGMSGREVARRFTISSSSVSRWRARLRQTGSVSADPVGGDRRSKRIEAHADLILARMAAEPDTTLEEYQTLLASGGEHFGLTTIWRFFLRRQITHKKRLRTPRSSNAPT